MEFVNEMIKGDHISSPSEEEMECKAAVVTVKKSVAQRVQKIVSENASVERRSSARLRNRPENKRPYYGHSSSEDVKDDGSRKNTKLRKRRELEYDVVEETECCKTGPVLERLGEVKVYADATCGEDVQKMDERGDHNPTDAVGKSAYARVKETLRMFNTHYLHFVQEEEKRCRKDEVDAKKVARGSKSESVQRGNASEEDTKRSSKRPDLKAISKMMETNAVLYRGKRFGHLPGIDVGYQFFSRAAMVAIGFHSHWLNGIDFMGQSYKKMKEYSGYTFPLAVAIVLSGQYEDDLDNSEDVVYTGQGGNNLLGNKRQVKDQVMERGNLALKNSLEQCVPVRVIRGHESTSSYCGKVYTYDGLYKGLSCKSKLKTQKVDGESLDHLFMHYLLDYLVI
ncbi:E3 ubiquitin-protein ligase UHRF1-like isoform X1 [Macadamia integrifolia]|uniref:E3 ubiquitin-protein ligase UHRF1-like isoform X1 n=1 Tax=Macadamia integrifolia TaxID=60698 RepID=UPI001C4E9EC9|nr:E3 ubiquitin-protein ligase UHRF1-like isoform X1 [Macadamia integrifolia]